MNVWCVGANWRESDTNSAFKFLVDSYFAYNYAGFGYEKTDDSKTAKTAWKNLRLAKKGDLVYVKDSQKNGKRTIHGVGVVIDTVIGEFDREQEGYGLRVQWLTKEPFVITGDCKRGAFAQERNAEVLQAIFQRLYEISITGECTEDSEEE